MSLIKSLLFTLLLAAAAVQASTRDEIERLWNPQGMAAQPAQPAADTSARTEKPAPRWFRLSNGRQVNLADWKVVLFMQGHCPYCHQFDPVLKQLAQQYGFSVFPYTLDGQGDTAFPEALPVPPDVMQTFFPNIPVTDYIGYDILLQYIQELIQQARAMVATGNYDEAVIEHINDNMNDATRQIAAFQSQVQVQQDALLVVDRQMSYMRQQLSARMLSRYQNNYHFGGSTL